MKKKLIVLASVVLGSAPVAALAQGVAFTGTATSCGSGETTIFSLLCRVGQILNSIVPILIALGVVYFVWGVISYVVGGDEEAKKKGRDKIVYGIIGLAAIVAVWGLVAILNRTFGIDNNATLSVPTVPIAIPGQ